MPFSLPEKGRGRRIPEKAEKAPQVSQRGHATPCGLERQASHAESVGPVHMRADELILEMRKPYDDEQGWIRTDDGVMEPVWSCSPVLQNSLVDLLDIGHREEVK